MMIRLTIYIQKHFWRHYRKCILKYDFIFAYREKNIRDYEKIGYKRVRLLKPYYIRERNFYMSNLLTIHEYTDIVDS
jgi:ribosomal protein S18 acetylase RimI-like enzyme